MTFADLLTAYGNKISVGPLALNQHGVCQLVFDGEIFVDIEHQQGESFVYLSAAVVEADPMLPTNVLRELLHANLMGRGTDGACLAIDPEREEVVLWRSLPVAGLTTELFETVISSFLATLEAWRRQFEAVDELDAFADLDGVASSEGTTDVIVRA